VAIKSLSTYSVKNSLSRSSNFQTGITRSELQFSIHAKRNLDSNNTIPDLSGNNFNATKTSQLTTNSLGYWDFGLSPHRDKYILIPNGSINNATSWSFEVWVRASNVGGRYWFHGGGGDNRNLIGPSGVNLSTNVQDWYIGTTGGSLFGSYIGGDSGAYLGNPPVKVYEDQLHHVVFALEPGAVRLYVDGLLVIKTPSTNPDGSSFSAPVTAQTLTLNNSFWFGQELDSNGDSAEPNPYSLDVNQSFCGRLYSLRLYGKSLSANEVKRNFDSGVDAI
jgi:hypothetical protein